MGVTLVLPIQQGETGRHTASKIVETVATFVEKAGLGKDDVVKVTCFEGGYETQKVYYDIALQIAPKEQDEEPEYEIVRVKFNNLGAWEIEPISYNPPRYPFGKPVRNRSDLRTEWEFQVNVLLLALQHLLSYRAEVEGDIAEEGRVGARELRKKVRRLKSKINDKSLLS